MHHKEKSEFTYGIKLSPEHFPVGTLFKVNPTLRNGADKDTIFEATGYVYNTPNHFVITTTHWNEACGVHDSYSHSHIREIIKRGDGPIVNMDEVRKRVRQIGKKGDNTNQFGDAHAWGIGNKEKTHYVFFDAESLVHHQITCQFKKSLAKGDTLDIDLFARSLMRQPFVKSVVDDGSSHYRSFLYVASKKRLDKWLKQNLKRFLMPVKKAQRLYDQAMDEIYWQDLERDMDYDLDIYKDPDEFEKIPGIREDVPGEDNIPTEIPSKKEMLDKIVEEVKKMSPEEFREAIDKANQSEVVTALREMGEALQFVADADETQNGATITTPNTGRYSIGEEIYAMSYIYETGGETHSSCLRPLTWLQENTPKEVKFIKLTVKEHHKVPIEYTNDLGDGYILETDDPSVKYTNQYPVASYGQVTDTGNRIFTLDTRDKNWAQMEEIVDNETNHPIQWINITDHVNDIYVAAHGKDRETMIKANPDRHQQLVDVYKMINDTFEAQFPGKQLKIVPITLKRKDGTIDEYPDILTTIVVDKA